MQTEAAHASGSGRATKDEQLVAALRGGDERAFHELYERYYAAMKRVARNYVDSDTLADEIVQETWLGILGSIERFEGRSALATWMFSILINQAKSHSTKERRTLPLSSLGSGDEPAVDADRLPTTTPGPATGQPHPGRGRSPTDGCYRSRPARDSRMRSRCCQIASG